MGQKITVALMLLAVVFIVAHLEYRFAPVEQAIRSDPPQIVFQRPLDCDAIVAQRGAGEAFVSLCYVKGKR